MEVERTRNLPKFTLIQKVLLSRCNIFGMLPWTPELHSTADTAVKCRWLKHIGAVSDIPCQVVADTIEDIVGNLNDRREVTMMESKL